MHEFKTKDEVRIHAKEVRKKIGRDEILKRSSLISKKIQELEAFQKAKNIMSYYPLEYEISLIDLFSLKDKNWYLPIIDKKIDTPNLLISKYDGNLEKSLYGIMEPKLSNENTFDQINKKLKLDIIIIPGLAFDKFGKRIGYGKGFYDSFLKLNPDSLKIGCCVNELFFESIPNDKNDVSVDLVLRG